MTPIISNSWQAILSSEFEKPYFKTLQNFLQTEYATQTIYPQQENIFAALEHTPYEEVKVVLLGQDPYHGANQAQGLSFSVQPGVKIPPSLRNIYKELEADLGLSPVEHGSLIAWAEQGVLLLNTVLTVREGQANSHRQQGWEQLTDTIIKRLNEREEPVVFILWGKPAQQKIKMIDTAKHIIIQSAHPSPLSAYRGFFGSAPFSKTNEALIQLGKPPIDWQLPEKV